MSVVAGCSMLDGVLLAADTRVSHPNGMVADRALKVFPLAPGTAIGYVGSVRLAGLLLKPLWSTVELKRDDPFSLIHWLPRYFRREYKKVCAEGKCRTDEHVSFLVASAPFRRLQEVDRALLWSIADRGIKDGMRTIDGAVMRLLTSNAKRIRIPQTLLYEIAVPDFEPRMCKPLSMMAIGSGRKAVAYVEDAHPSILMQNDQTTGAAPMWFRSRLSLYAEAHGIDSVGGLYPTLVVQQRRTGYVPQGESIYASAKGVHARVSLVMENNTWHQIGHMTGTHLPLLHPWNDELQRPIDRKFDEHDKRRLSDLRPKDL